MFLRELRELFRQEIRADKDEIDVIFYIVLEHFFGIRKLDFTLEPTKILSELQIQKMKMALDCLKSNMPVQYVVGQTFFFNSTIALNTNVLIPRPETEALVHWITNRISHPNRILDICTGSGCISVALAKHFPMSEVEALDISEEALKVATVNAKNNEVEIDFYNKDIFECDDLGGFFDVIISNPPYVLKSEKSQMCPNVLDYEPSVALFVGNDNPLLFYDKIGRLAKYALIKSGQLFFEINENFGEDTINLLKDIGYTQVQLKKDINGKDRMVSAQL